jgi:hypothetical protein
MGAGSSTSLDKGNAYSKRAEESEARVLADKILDVFFKNADFKDLLNLSSIQGCPAYVFTTAEALKGMFQTLKVEPKIGKKGEILFAPVSKLAPGLVKGRDMDERMRVITQERNRQCMDVAYFYVRIFQIYAALALTVLDANPVRRSRSISYTSQQKPGRAIFTGGATADEMKIFKDTFLEPFKINKSFLDKSFEFDKANNKLKYKGDTNIYMSIKLPSPIPKRSDISSLSLACDLIKGSNSVETIITLRYDNNEDQNIILSVDNKDSLIFYRRTDFTRVDCIYDGSLTSIADINSFISCILKNFPELTTASTSSQSLFSSSSSSSSSSSLRGSITAPSGKSVFTGFEDMKKVLEQRFTGKGYPKAYCIARAMTLLNPIFSTERLNPKQLFITQICSKVFDFEVGGIDAMPRLDRPPNANLYFKSLISLYYDDYKLNRDGTFSQSQTIPGKNNLIEASKLLAALYSIDDKEGKFLESSTRFPRIKVCEKEGYLAIKDTKLVNLLQKDIIMPMLKLQEEHTKSVNAFFKKMFEFKNGEFRFSGQLREGGNEAVRNLGSEAASLLLNYYLKSEAFYIKGTRIIEQNKNLLESIL